MGHTPGPWRAENIYIYNDSPRARAIEDREGAHVLGEAYVSDGEETDNARLMAAAPDMIVVLEFIHTDLEESVDGRDAWERMIVEVLSLAAP